MEGLLSSPMDPPMRGIIIPRVTCHSFLTFNGNWRRTCETNSSCLSLSLGLSSFSLLLLFFFSLFCFCCFFSSFFFFSFFLFCHSISQDKKHPVSLTLAVGVDEDILWIKAGNGKQLQVAHSYSLSGQSSPLLFYLLIWTVRTSHGPIDLLSCIHFSLSAASPSSALATFALVLTSITLTSSHVSASIVFLEAFISSVKQVHWLKQSENRRDSRRGQWRESEQS